MKYRAAGCVAILCITGAAQAASVIAHIDDLGITRTVEWIEARNAAPIIEVVDVGDASKGLAFAQKICSPWCPASARLRDRIGRLNGCKPSS